MKRAAALADRAATLSLGLIGAFNLLFIVAVLVALLSAAPRANAQEAVACTGEDMLAQMERDDPALLAQIRAEAAEIENGGALLWRIERAGVAPSFLFGTMHVSDPRVVRLAGAAQAAFDAADTVVIETTDVLDQSIVMREFASRADLMMFPEGESLTDHLADAQQEELSSWLQERGVPFQSIIKMKPWMILFMASQPSCEVSRQAKGAKILDIVLADRAKAAGKNIAGLETLAEQFEALNAFSTDVQLRALLSTAALGDKMDDIMETLTRLYVAGETGMFTPAVQQLVPHDPVELDDFTRFEERVVVMRNHVMAARAADYLNEGNAFIAVGALHLPGQEGVIELLREAGWNVDRADE